MAGSLTASEEAALTGVVAELDGAWSSGDGAANGSPMADDADVVTIRAEHHRGRQAIAVLTREPGDWKIASFHSTPAPKDSPGRRQLPLLAVHGEDRRRVAESMGNGARAQVAMLREDG
jgi:hypothetical protein